MTTTRRPVAQLGIDTKALVDYLMTAEEGQLVPYSTLHAVIGRDVQTTASGNLVSARRILQSQYQIVFSVVRGTGLVRLTEVETINSAHSEAPVVLGRAARRIARKVTAVKDFDALPNDVKIKHNTTLSFVQTVAHMGKAKPMKQLETKIAEVNTTLSIAATIEALGKV